jgi:hypothetical protein
MPHVLDGQLTLFGGLCPSCGGTPASWVGVVVQE